MKRRCRSRRCFWISAVSCSTTGGTIIARRKVAKHFKLEWAEMEERHRLTFETHEEGKLTFEEYLRPRGLLPKATVHPGSVSALHVRAIEALPRDD